MRDKRPVDELSVEELEQVLAIKRREERQQRMQRMQRSGRVIETVDAAAPEPDAPIPPPAAEVPPPPAHDPVAAALASLTQPAVRETGSPDPSPRFEDNTAEPPPLAQVKARKRARRRVMDRVLLLVEVLAVLLIVVIGVNLFQAIGKLDAESAKAQQAAEDLNRQTIPTIAPTPTIRLENVVLPGGHIIAPNGAPQFNYNEIPTSLYDRVQSEWVQPVLNRPPQTSETALALIVPRINLNGTIVQGVDWEALKQGVGQVPNGINPGDDVGNVSFAAHNDIYGKLFQHLDQLEVGDTFQIQTKTTVYTYTVSETRIVAPNDVGVLEPRQGATATLISCYPYQVDDKRIVVFADRVS
jgi:sortase A